MSRDKVFADFSSMEPAEFRSLVHAPYRIIAPAHGTFRDGEKDAHYLDRYSDEVWEKYRLEALTFTNQQGTFTGQVDSDGVFWFKEAKAPSQGCTASSASQAPWKRCLATAFSTMPAIPMASK
jgi:hypothetical protein